MPSRPPSYLKVVFLFPETLYYYFQQIIMQLLSLKNLMCPSADIFLFRIIYILNL